MAPDATPAEADGGSAGFVNALRMTNKQDMPEPFARNDWEWIPNSSSWGAGNYHGFESRIRLPADLTERMARSSQQWWNLASFKTWGQTGSGDHPHYNVALYIYFDGDRGAPYWSVVAWAHSEGDSTERFVDWSYDNREVPVPEGRWFDFFWGFRYSGTSSDGAVDVHVDGRPVFEVRRRIGASYTDSGIGQTGPVGVYTGLSWSGIEATLFVQKVSGWDALPAHLGGSATTPHFSSSFDPDSRLVVDLGTHNTGPYMTGTDTTGPGDELSGNWDALDLGEDGSRYTGQFFQYVNGQDPDEWANNVETELVRVSAGDDWP